jgi:hypothetical protein
MSSSFPPSAQAAAALAKLAHENKETQDHIVRCSGVKPLIKLLEMGRGLLPSPFSFARVVSMQVAKSLPGASAVEDVAEGGSFRRSRVGHWRALQADLAEATAQLDEDPNVKYRSARQNAAFALASLSDEPAVRHMDVRSRRNLEMCPRARSLIAADDP